MQSPKPLFTLSEVLQERRCCCASTSSLPRQLQCHRKQPKSLEQPHTLTKICTYGGLENPNSNRTNKHCEERNNDTSGFSKPILAQQLWLALLTVLNMTSSVCVSSRSRIMTSCSQTMVILLFLLLTITSGVTSGRGDDLIVTTVKGRVRGIRYHLPNLNKAVDAFLGIPFAKAPLDHLRFKHPQPIEEWQGIYNATKLPNSCYQDHDEMFGEFKGATMWNPNTLVSEDCLYLNVWVPKTHPRIKKSAVMIWIYGGGFYSGTTTLNVYDGKVLAAENNIIIVSISYRVGALGFLSLGHPSAPGNAGMFDQLMGLEWVQQNIRHFGGDPNNVTLFGESAGSVSVSLHLLSPLSRPKFQRAILQSGVAICPWATVSSEEGTRRSVELAVDILGCPRSGDMDDVAECLRRIPPQRLVEMQWISHGIAQFPFVPIIDGSFLVEHPDLSMERENFKKCPILLGSNLNEGAYFLIYELTDYLKLNMSTMTRDQFQTSIQQLFFWYPQWPQQINRFGLEAIAYQYTNWIDPDDMLNNIVRLDQAVGDYYFTCNVNTWADYYAKAGESVYYYYFTERYQAHPWPPWMGVLHADEIFFMFGEPFKQGMNYTEGEKALSGQMMRYWTNFAKTGDPNRAPGHASVNEWHRHSPKGKEYLELNSRFVNSPEQSLAIQRGPRSQQCAFWKEYLPKLVAATKDTSTAEQEWKVQFHEWSTKYIVDWKQQYDTFLRNDRDNRNVPNCKETPPADDMVDEDELLEDEDP